MPKSIFVIDDEPELVALLEMGLGSQGYLVTSAASGSEAIEKLRTHRPDLILMDIMLPDISGTRLTGQIKNDPRTAAIPVIMLTARDSATDVIVGLNMGADDYVTKPFSIAVLAARIEAVLRRKQTPQLVSQDTLAAGDITLNPGSRQCTIAGRSIDLTPTEFRILRMLMEAKGDVVTLEELGRIVGSGKDTAERNIYVHISSLRRKLGDAKKSLRTVQGLGYRIDAGG